MMAPASANALPPWGGRNWGNRLTQDARVRQGEELTPWIAEIKAGMALDTRLTETGLQD
jgi:hypothetical protein